MKTAFTKSPLRRVAVGGAVALGATALLITNLPAHADNATATDDASCELEILEKPDGSGKTFAYGMDPTGTYVIGEHFNGEGEQVQLWTDGKREAIELNGTDVSPFDVDSNGVAVGYYTNADTSLWTPFIYEDGQARDLPLGSDNQGGGTATTINEDGVITGSVIDFDGYRHAAYWPSADSEPIELETPDHTESFVRDVSDDGTMIGQHNEYIGGGYHHHPYVWDAEGNGQPLPGTDDDFDGYPDSIAGDYIVGKDRARGNAVMWTGGGEAQPLEGLDAAKDVTADGTVAGDTADGRAAILSLDGELTELPRMDDDAEKDDRTDAISADGTIIAGNVHSNDTGNLHPARWTCA